MSNPENKKYVDYQEKMLSKYSKQILDMFNRMLALIHVTYKVDTKFYPRSGCFEVVVMQQTDANLVFGLIKNEENRKKMIHLMDRLNECPKTPIIASDVFCFSFLDGNPCRAFIISRDQSRAQVYFLDWGNIDYVDIPKCYRMRDDIMKICPLCMPFELKGCPFDTPVPELPQPVTLSVDVKCINGPRKTILVDARYNNRPYFELFSATRKIGNKIRSNLGNDDPCDEIESSFEGLTIINNTLPIFTVGQDLKIKVTSVLTPSHFLFQPADATFQTIVSTTVEQLRTTIERMSSFKKDNFINEVIREGHIVILADENITNRGEILSISRDSGNGIMVQLMLFEEGRKTITSADNIYPCPRDLRQLPEFFYKGSLNNVKPYGSSCWDAKATRTFAQLVEKTVVRAQVTFVGKYATNRAVNNYYMDLYPENLENVSVADILVDSNFAIPFKN